MLCGGTVKNLSRLDFCWRHQDACGAPLSQHGHTGEQIGCWAIQGEMDLQGHRSSSQPTGWLKQLQLGCGIRPTEVHHSTINHLGDLNHHSRVFSSARVSYSVRPSITVALGPTVQPDWWLNILLPDKKIARPRDVEFCPEVLKKVIQRCILLIFWRLFVWNLSIGYVTTHETKQTKWDHKHFVGPTQITWKILCCLLGSDESCTRPSSQEPAAQSGCVAVRWSWALLICRIYQDKNEWFPCMQTGLKVQKQR